MSLLRIAPALALAAAASPAFTAGEVRPTAATTHTVVIDRMVFGALPANLRVGDTIVWVNRDVVRHTATASDRSFDVDLPAGRSGRTKLTRAGRIAFVCKFHPGMKGVLVVAP